MSAPLPTPADIPVGHVVRLRLGGNVYLSPVMSPTEAKTLSVRVLNDVTEGAHRDGGFVASTCVDGRFVQVKARAVTAVEVGPLSLRTERPAAETPEEFADRVVTA